MLNNVSNASAYNASSTQLNASLPQDDNKIVFVQQNFFLGGAPQGGYAVQPQMGGYMMPAAPSYPQQSLFGGSFAPQDLGLMGLGAQMSSFGGLGLAGLQQPSAGSLLGGSLMGNALGGLNYNLPVSNLASNAYGNLFGGSNSISLLIGSILNNLQNILLSLMQLVGLYSADVPAGNTGNGAGASVADQAEAIVSNNTVAAQQQDDKAADKPAVTQQADANTYTYTPEQQAAYNNNNSYDIPTPPPVYEKPKVLGSAGLFGDPQFGLFSPNLGNIPEKLKAFESGIQNGQEVTLINDADKSGLNVAVKGVQVDPNNVNSTGVGEVTLKSGNDVVVFKNNGDLLVNGAVKGNINADGLIAPITLASGAVISTAQEIDGAGGVKAERFSFSNGEYKITAALRKPHADSQNYFDMNFEELVKDAADNATGYNTSIPGLANKFGIVDLLKLEPNDLANIT